MKPISILIAALLATGAEAAPVGKQISEIYLACEEAAFNQCGRESVRCRAFRRSYIKVCLINNEVPADYIEMLLNT